MIRAITRDDAPAVAELAVDAGLFPAEESSVVTTMMTRYFGGKNAEGHRCLIDEDNGPLAVAYYEPALATDRTWYLTMIAVRRSHQGHGRGTALLQHVEDNLRARDQRLLLVETSGLAAFKRTRAFYRQCGYEQEARIRDYYQPDDDMIVFRKALATASVSR